MDELTPLNVGINIPSDSEDCEDDFFVVVQEQLSRISKFFVGKLAELRICLDMVTSKQRNAYRTHHTSNDVADLSTLRDVYVELAALRSFCELNKSGLVKIIKKHDKILEKTTLESWIPVIERQPFSTSPEPLQLMEVVTSYVSRDKLMEWERHATEMQAKGSDDIMPSVRVQGLVISIVIFVMSLTFPLITPHDPAASKCMSLLLFTVSLWITEAIPYFATALMIPPLVVFLGVLKDTDGPNVTIMTTDKSAQFVLNHMFNHTTVK